ncbi:MAG: type VI secretion system contractile sheath large subunit [Acidobacteria bacterium]|nr:type VI secretion system contractile sheath large subunit [Acidobacteriota bacterium]
MPITDSNLEGMFTFETGATPSPDDPPFHILFLGDWSGDGAKPELAKRRPFMIDRDNFGALMERLDVSLELDIGVEKLRLSFRDIDDFHPDSLFRNLPVFADLRDVRRRLRSADSFDEAAGEVRSWFAVPEPVSQVDEEPKPASAFSLDDILSVRPTRRSDESDLSRLISQVVEPFLVKIDENEQSKLVSAVDAAISDLMRSVLHHPRFQALESAWRGLFFAVRRIDTDIDLKLYALDLTKDECLDNLKSVSSLAETVIYREVIRERVEMVGADAFAVICGNYSFGSNVDDVAALMRLGKLANAANAPFISMMRPEMFGLGSFESLPEPSAFKISDESTEGKLWAAIRGVPEAGFLGMCPMRFLARAPYGAKSDPLETFEFEEFSGLAKHQELVWINPSFACAVLLAESYRAYGWDMGEALRRDISGLPLYHYEVDGEKKLKPCAETEMTEVIAETLLENGLMPLISFRDSDRVRLARFESIASPSTTLGGRWNR